LDFLEVDCPTNSVFIKLNLEGRPSGEAIVEVSNEKELN